MSYDTKTPSATVPDQSPPAYTAATGAPGSVSPPAPTSDIFPQATGPAETAAPLPHHSPRPQQASPVQNASPFQSPNAHYVSPQTTGASLGGPGMKQEWHPNQQYGATYEGHYSPNSVQPDGSMPMQQHQQQPYAGHPGQGQQYNQYQQGQYQQQGYQQQGPQQSHHNSLGQQGSQQGQGFSSVTPLYALGSSSSPINCPNCGQRSMTRTELITGNTTHAWAAGLFITTCCCCIPYLISSTKDVEHKCGNCGIKVATWHRSGRTEVHAHS